MAHQRYPEAARLDLTETIHGRPVADPYRWLEDAGDPRTVAWLAAQDELLGRERAGWLAHDGLHRQLADLTSMAVESCPRPRGERLFLTRRDVGREHAALIVVEADGAERVVLDPEQIDPAGTTTLEGWQPSINGGLLAYQLAVGGTEESVLRVLDVGTGEIVDGPIDRVRRTPVAWLPGGEAFYYVRRLHPDLVPAGEARYHRRIYLHRVGTDPHDDMLIFGAGRGKADHYAVSVSADGRWLTITASAGTAPRNELWLADLSVAGPGEPGLAVLHGGADARTVAHIRAGTSPEDPIYLVTDRDAGYGRLCIASARDPAYRTWRDLVGEDRGAVLRDIAILDGAELGRPLLLVKRTRHAVSEIAVHDLADGTRLGSVPLPGPGTVGEIVDHPGGGHEAWFTYEDFTTPPAIYRYDGRSGRTERWTGRGAWAVPPSSGVPGPAARGIETCHLAYASADGTPVRMFVVSPAGRPDHPRPAILTGYGGFGVSMAPGYSPMILAWVQAGGVFAVAGLRGGGEQGDDWHRAGMLGRKQNVFDDLHAAADCLTADGWTTSWQLGIFGGSNGGLLVGAALTQHPEKYAAAVCSAPLLDMVRYERSGLGAAWSSEYGTAADPEQLGWLLSYSPYHNVRDETAYPAVLFTVFDADTRVDPLHARKMCAALQHASGGERPIVMRRERDVGHGSRAFSREIDLLVDVLAFFVSQLGQPTLALTSPVHQGVRGA
jgi:prolyl oligopeptidase